MKLASKAFGRVVAGLVCLGMLCTLPSSQLVTTAFAVDEADVSDSDRTALGDLNSQYDELEKKQKEYQAEIAKAKSEKDKQLAIKNQLSGQVETTRQQISILNQQIVLLTETIAAHEETIAEKQKSIDVNMAAYKERMRATYMAGNSSTLGMMLGAESISEFLTQAEITTRIAQRDNALIHQLEQDMEDVRVAMADLAADQASLETAKGAQASKQTELSGQISSVESQIQDIAALQKDYENDKAKIDAEMSQVQSEIDTIYANYTSEGTYDGGIMTWPVPGYPNITSYYGWRFNNTNYHTGIDISGGNVYRKNIVAAADGVVITTKETFVPGKGYGRYLMIDHGGGISTLYGHTDELLVTTGQKVARGQAIARVGTTGWSTGPHLHFEVRVNGAHKNPLNGYLK